MNHIFLKNLKISNRAFLLFSPISILAFPVSLLIVNPEYSAFALGLLGVILTFLTFLVYFTLNLIYSSLKSQQTFLRFSLFIVVILITGFFRGLFFYWIVEHMALNQPSNLTTRILGSTFTTFFWLTVSNIITNASDTFKYQYQSALNNYLSTNQKTTEKPEMSDESRAEINMLQLNLKKSVEKILNQSDPDSLNSLASILTNQINNQIRPLSQRIWIRSLNEFPVVHYTKLFKDSVNNLDLPWPLFYLIISGLALIDNLAIRNFNESFIRTSTFLLLVLVLASGYRVLVKKFTANTFILNMIFLILVGFIPVFFGELAANIFGYRSGWIANLLITPVAPAVIIILSLLRLTQRDRALLISSLRNVDNTNNLIHHSNQVSLASYLHNSLQSELLSLSKKLENAAKAQTPENSIELLQQVSSLINRSFVDDFAQFNQTPLKRLASVIESWRGILEIKMNIDQMYLSETSRNAIIVQVIEEVATNVYRHGGATELKISSRSGTDGLILCFQSNGNRNLKKSKGFGTTWFDQIALRPWSIEKNSKGYVFEIEI